MVVLMRIRQLLLCFILSPFLTPFRIFACLLIRHSFRYKCNTFFVYCVHLVCLDCFFSLLFSRSLVPSFSLSLHISMVSISYSFWLAFGYARSVVRSFFSPSPSLFTRFANIKYSHGRNVCNAHVLLATIYKQKNCL